MYAPFSFFDILFKKEYSYAYDLSVLSPLNVLYSLIYFFNFRSVQLSPTEHARLLCVYYLLAQGAIQRSSYKIRNGDNNSLKSYIKILNEQNILYGACV